MVCRLRMTQPSRKQLDHVCWSRRLSMERAAWTAGGDGPDEWLISVKKRITIHTLQHVLGVTARLCSATTSILHRNCSCLGCTLWQATVGPSLDVIPVTLLSQSFRFLSLFPSTPSSRFYTRVVFQCGWNMLFLITSQRTLPLVLVEHWQTIILAIYWRCLPTCIAVNSLLTFRPCFPPGCFISDMSVNAPKYVTWLFLQFSTHSQPFYGLCIWCYFRELRPIYFSIYQHLQSLNFTVCLFVVDLIAV